MVKIHVIHSEAGIALNLFLIFGDIIFSNALLYMELKQNGEVEVLDEFHAACRFF